MAAQIPENVEEILKQFDVPFKRITDKEIPGAAKGKLSENRPFWEFRMNSLYFMDAEGNAYHATLPAQEAQGIIQTIAQIPGLYMPSRILNRIPDNVLTKEQRQRKHERNTERKYRT